MAATTVASQAQLIAALVALLPAGTVVTLPAEAPEAPVAPAPKAPKATKSVTLTRKGRLDFVEAHAWADRRFSTLDLAIAVCALGAPLTDGFAIGESYAILGAGATVAAKRYVRSLMA